MSKVSMETFLIMQAVIFAAKPRGRARALVMDEAREEAKQIIDLNNMEVDIENLNSASVTERLFDIKPEA